MINTDFRNQHKYTRNPFGTTYVFLIFWSTKNEYYQYLFIVKPEKETNHLIFYIYFLKFINDCDC